MARPGSHHREQPRHGVCGVCGAKIPIVAMRFSPWVECGQGYENWRAGHYYDQRGHLQIVRCLRHGGRGFNPSLRAELAN